jgi:hypothetical protein
LLPENRHPTPSLKIKRTPASKVTERASATWKKIIGKTVEQSLKKCCITKALVGIEVEILWGIFNLESLILRDGKDPPDFMFSHLRRLRNFVTSEPQISTTYKYILLYFNL